jgi:hypothetical protein
MPILRVFLARIGDLFRRSQAEAALAEELRAHLEMAIEENLRRGMSLEEARHSAQVRFGGVEQAKEACRDSWGIRWLEDLWKDARCGIRTLCRNPGFTTVVLLVLSLGIGANSVVFSVV